MSVLRRLLVAAVGLLSGLAALAQTPELPRRGDLGARLSFEASATPGGKVARLRPGGPAEQAGLKVGDVITHVNGRPLDSGTAVAQFMRRPAAGEKLALTVARAGATQTIEFTPPEYPRESYANADITYTHVTDAKGQRLRVTVTRPKNAAGKVPVIFIAGWLSDNPVESPPPFQDEISQLFRGLVETSGCALYRVDKPGSGDSDGDAATGDFDTELAGYQLAFREMARFDFLDRERVFIFGLSNGGGYAPLVAQGAPVRGYIVYGGWAKTWFEHMLEIERRIATLSGKTPGEVNTRQKGIAELYTDYLIHGRAPAEIFAAKPHLQPLWTDPTPATQYGRPPAYYQQLQKLNLAEAWSKVNVPALVMHGEFDWIMSREDHELIASWINRNQPGAAEFVAVPKAGHGYQTFASWEKSFSWQAEAYDQTHLTRIKDWLARQR
jgi:pimeloyl-ACP methyl ester carboxylesterase